ncbi:hypothetical protein V0288_17450 [Pannus brasiliensis CCIBt3594]|uniref:Uncharacterized protein n=1 Tax=Pannus brasiliensis CCIBt3594 TaxID=1427578 RepID=A0AAW9QM99_9CHRO
MSIWILALFHQSRIGSCWQSEPKRLSINGFTRIERCYDPIEGNCQQLNPEILAQ